MRYPLDGPVRVNSPYGPRGSGFHYGVDLFAMDGTPAYAVDSGEVFYTAFEAAGGNHLAMYLDHPPVPEAPKFGYMHLQRFAVAPGTRVNEGDVVGWTGSTGAVDGPHLHAWLGTNANVGAIDPLPYIGAPSMTIFGVDLSKYQGPNAMDGYDFAILNVEDPTLGDKIYHAYDTGVRWDIYKWCYPGQSGQALFDRARDLVNPHHRAGTRRPQFWLDYEEAGVETWQIDQWYAACDQAGEATGLYIYLYLMNNQGVWFTRDGWLAYYPGTNSGNYYDSMSDVARTRGAKLHQYTSSGGTLDKNVVLDEAWYRSTPTPEPPAPPPDPSPVAATIVNQREDTMYAWTADNAGPTLPWFESGMLYEFTPYQVTRCPGVAAKDVLGSVQVTGDTMYGLMAARFRTATALNIPIA